MSRDIAQQLAAVQAVRAARKSGELAAGLCDVCGGTNTEPHHEDHSKPLDVRWLCKSHHSRLTAAIYQEHKRRSRIGLDARPTYQIAVAIAMSRDRKTWAVVYPKQTLPIALFGSKVDAQGVAREYNLNRFAL